MSETKMASPKLLFYSEIGECFINNPKNKEKMDNDYIIFISSSPRTCVDITNERSALPLVGIIDTINSCFGQTIEFGNQGLYPGYSRIAFISNYSGAPLGYEPPLSYGLYGDGDNEPKVQQLYERYPGLKEEATKSSSTNYGYTNFRAVVIGVEHRLSRYEGDTRVFARGLNDKEIELLENLFGVNGFKRFPPKK